MQFNLGLDYLTYQPGVDKTVDFILSALSSRLADSIREEMTGLGKVTAKDAEEAMNTVVAAIRRMEAAGDLFLIAADAEAEDE